MQPTSRTFVILTGAVLLGFVSSAVAHGHDESEDMNVNMSEMSSTIPSIPTATSGAMAEPASYFQLKEQSGLIFRPYSSYDHRMGFCSSNR